MTDQINQTPYMEEPEADIGSNKLRAPKRFQSIPTFKLRPNVPFIFRLGPPFSKGAKGHDGKIFSEYWEHWGFRSEKDNVVRPLECLGGKKNCPLCRYVNQINDKLALQEKQVPSDCYREGKIHMESLERVNPVLAKNIQGIRKFVSSIRAKRNVMFNAFSPYDQLSAGKNSDPIKANQVALLKLPKEAAELLFEKINRLIYTVDPVSGQETQLANPVYPWKLADGVWFSLTQVWTPDRGGKDKFNRYDVDYMYENSSDPTQRKIARGPAPFDYATFAAMAVDVHNYGEPHTAEEYEAFLAGNFDYDVLRSSGSEQQPEKSAPAVTVNPSVQMGAPSTYVPPVQTTGYIAPVTAPVSPVMPQPVTFQSAPAFAQPVQTPAQTPPPAPLPGGASDDAEMRRLLFGEAR